MLCEAVSTDMVDMTMQGGITILRHLIIQDGTAVVLIYAGNITHYIVRLRISQIRNNKIKNKGN